MEFDDLLLGLGFRSASGEIKPKMAENFDFPVTTREPSLTLTLSGETYDHFPPAKKMGSDHLTRDESAASSFSSVKREREFRGGEEAKIEKVSSRISDEDDEGSTRRKLRLSKTQSALLEENFKQHSTLNPSQKQELARNLKLIPRQVEVWFQNRRARTRLKQTEVDCEFLKKCCETLTDENRRLQKELAELKALKSAPPLYMQIPAATLAMCPSCERISGSGAAVPKTAAKSPFIVAPKQHFFNPFTDPSAAC